MIKRKHYIVYQITNKINNHIYIGIHITERINDKYMGSGSNIKKAIKEFGKENFEKIILYNFDTKEEMLEKEKELVNEEFIKRGDTYNIILGGGRYAENSVNTVTVKDKNGNMSRVHKTDPRYLSGELVHNYTNMVMIKDKNGNIFLTDKTNPRYLSGELVGHTKGSIIVKDENDNTFTVKQNDPRYLSGELVGHTKGLITVKDKNNNTLQVSVDDPRYLSGELISIWEGRRHKLETRLKMRNAKKGKYKGKENSQFGTCWIYNEEIKESKKIKREELDNWLDKGWLKGRKIKF